MALKIFGKSEVEEELDRLEAKIASLENQVSSDLAGHVTTIDGKITKLTKGQADLKKKAVDNSGKLSKLQTISKKNSTIIEKQVEEGIPLEIGKLQRDVAEINAKIDATRVILDKIMGILKQVTAPENRLNQKVMKLEDQMEVMGRIDLIHLVDKLEIIKEQLQKAHENFLPPEVSEKLQALDLKLHQMDKRLDGIEDQMIRPIEEVETN